LQPRALRRKQAGLSRFGRKGRRRPAKKGLLLKKGALRRKGGLPANEGPGQKKAALQEPLGYKKGGPVRKATCQKRGGRQKKDGGCGRHKDGAGPVRRKGCR